MGSRGREAGIKAVIRGGERETRLSMASGRTREREQKGLRPKHQPSQRG